MAKRVFHIAFLAELVAGCSEDKSLDFEAGPLGAVEVDAGAAVQVRSMLPLTGLQNIAESNYHADSGITDVAQLPVEYQFAP